MLAHCAASQILTIMCCLIFTPKISRYTPETSLVLVLPNETTNFEANRNQTTDDGANRIEM